MDYLDKIPYTYHTVVHNGTTTLDEMMNDCIEQQFLKNEKLKKRCKLSIHHKERMNQPIAINSYNKGSRLWYDTQYQIVFLPIGFKRINKKNNIKTDYLQPTLIRNSPPPPIKMVSSKHRKGYKRSSKAERLLSHSQEMCCIKFCVNKSTNRLLYSLKLIDENEDVDEFKLNFLKKGWIRICHQCYFSDLYRSKKIKKKLI